MAEDQNRERELELQGDLQAAWEGQLVAWRSAAAQHELDAALRAKVARWAAAMLARPEMAELTVVLDVAELGRACRHTYAELADRADVADALALELKRQAATMLRDLVGRQPSA